MADSRMNRIQRNLETREGEQKSAHAIWRPAALLPEPDERPGIGHRWIATEVLGHSLHTNVSSKIREGWEPVKAADYPELMIPGNKNGNVEVGGLLLCAAPKELIESRDAYYQGQTKAQTDALDSKFLGMSDPRMPTFSEKKSGVSRGSFGNGV
jgi:hypothetical protein